MNEPSITLYTGGCKSGKTSELFRVYRQYINSGASSSSILVMVRNKTLEAEFRNRIFETFSTPLEEIQVFRFRAFAVSVIMKYWPYLFKKPPMFTGFSETLVTMKLFLRFKKKLYPGLPADKQIIKKLFERQQRRAENCFSHQELKQRTELLRESKIAHEANNFLEDYSQWLTGKDTPVLDYAAQLDCFSQLSEIPQVKQDILKNFPVAWLIDDIEEAIPAEQLFYQKFWYKGPAFVYTGNDYGGVRHFMGSDPEYLKDLKSKAVHLVELSEPARENKPAELGKKLFEILYSSSSVYNPAALANTSSFRLSARESYSEMLAELQTCLNNLKAKGTRPEEIAVIVPFFNETLEAEVENIITTTGWSLEALKGSHTLISNPLINTLLTIVRLIYREEMEESKKFLPLTGFEFSQMLSITGNTDNYYLGRLRQKFGNNNEKWLDFIEEYSRKEGFTTLRQIREIVDEYRSKKDTLALASDYREMFTVIWKRLIWKSSYFKQKPSVREFRIFLEMLENHLEVLQIISVKKPLLEFISQLLGGELSDNPDMEPEKSEDSVKFMTLQKLCEIKKETPYQIWLDISSDYWLKNPHHPIVNPNLLSRRWNTGKRWSLIEEENLLEQNLARRIRIALALCSRKVYFFSCDYTVMGQSQNFELIKNLLGNADLVR